MNFKSAILTHVPDYRKGYQDRAKRSGEILKQVRNLVKGCTYETKVAQDELVRSALYLLQTLPTARFAVFEHLATVYNDAVAAHIRQIGMRDLGNSSTDNGEDTWSGMIADIQEVLMGFVKSNPDGWAPIISSWSIELLGQLSSQYADRHGVPHATSLNEVLQLWMTCPPTKSLIEIASECFASMVGGSPDICVDALLEASVKHSPHFDWVVAHIGSCFPRTIINRVLMCGLKEFWLHGNSQSDSCMGSEEKLPKMASVVGILGHLAAQHAKDIREALLNLFKECLQVGASNMQLCTIPFLLQLASLSSMLLHVIALELVQTLTATTLKQLSSQLSLERMKKLQDPESLQNLVVHLITKCAEGAYEVLNFLLETACPEIRQDAMETEDMINPTVQNATSLILDQLLVDLYTVVHGKSGDGSVDIAFLTHLKHKTPTLCQQYAESHGNRQKWLSQLLKCLAVYCEESCAIDVMSHLLLHAKSPKQLGLFLQIQNEAQIRYPEVLEAVIQRIIDLLLASSQNITSRAQVLDNILSLVRWEKRGASDKTKTQVRCWVWWLLRDHLPSLAHVLCCLDIDTAAVAMEILDLIGLPSPIDPSVMLKLTCSVVNMLFEAFYFRDTARKLKICELCKRYLRSLCQYPVSQKTILKLLFTEIMSENAVVVGGKLDQELQTVMTKPERPCGAALLRDHRQLVAGAGLTQAHATVFHAGVIGQGLKHRPKPLSFSKEEECHNRQAFVDVLSSCCCEIPPIPNGAESTENSQPRRGLTPHISRTMALMVVEMVSPDVMYNGIPWPDEEFMKVTVERDLIIKKKFEDNPILWDLMEFLAEGPGAMCYCSVLLRGVMAPLLSFWEPSREKSARNCPKQLEMSCKLMQCMRKGQLLPPPLCYVGEILHLFSPYEVYLLLLNIWKFMKENPPIPEPRTSSQGCDPVYTEVLRSIMHNNLHKLGAVYARFFGQRDKTSAVTFQPTDYDSN